MSRSRPKWTDLTEVRRWLTLRCENCGHRFRWKRDARHSFGSRDGKVYHQWCLSAIEWRRQAEERLDIVALVTELAGLTERDVTIASELCAANETDRIAASNKAWRVFNALTKRKEAADA